MCSLLKIPLIGTGRSINSSNSSSICRNLTSLRLNFNSLKTSRNYCSNPVAVPVGNYTVEEIKIPVPSIGGHLAGKLWQGPGAKNSSSVPIICMHGIQDNCGSFDSIIPLVMRDHMSIFAVDLPGHGLSSHTKDLYYHAFFDGMITIRRVLNHFQWEKTILWGHSLGSICSFLYSACFPEQVHSYIAMDNFHPVPRPDPTHSYQNTINKLLQLEGKLLETKARPSYTYEELLQRTIQSRRNTVTSKGCEILLQRGAATIPNSDPPRYQFTHDIKTNIPSSFRFHSWEQMNVMAKRIKCPVCVIKGEPGEDYEPRSKFLETVEVVRGSSERLEFHLVPGTHHFHLNEPQLVAPIVNKFLES